MARAAKLKVFRTPIGLHDAYVAASSQKAALEAWGSDADLFARGIAELVVDRDLIQEPLEHPGEIIRRSRGSTAEQIAALPKSAPYKKAAGKKAIGKKVGDAKPAPPKKKAATARAAPVKAKPDRQPLAIATEELAQAEKMHRLEEEALARKIAELQDDLRHIKTSNSRTVARLEKLEEAEQRKYRTALQKWAEGS